MTNQDLTTPSILRAKTWVTKYGVYNYQQIRGESKEPLQRERRIETLDILRYEHSSEADCVNESNDFEDDGAKKPGHR
jgi:hypothetical protein